MVYWRHTNSLLLSLNTIVFMKGNMYHFYVEDINMMYIMIIIYIIKQIDNDWIVLLQTSVWYKISLNTSLTPPLSIEVPIPSQGSSWSCICVLRISTLPVSTTVVLDFGTVLKVWYFLLYILFIQWKFLLYTYYWQ